MANRSRPTVLASLAVIAIVALALCLRQDRSTPRPDELRTAPAATPATPNEPANAAPEIPVSDRESVPGVDAGTERLQGRVVATSSEHPIGRIQLTLEREVPAFVTIEMIAGNAQNARATDAPSVTSNDCAADGTFEIRGQRLVGYLAVVDPMYCVRDAIYVDAREKTTTRDVRVDAAGVVRGVVRDATGAPSKAAKIQIKPKVGLDAAFNREAKRKGREAVTDESGKFEIPHVPAGIEFDLSITAAGSLKQWRSVKTEAGKFLDVEVSLMPGVDVTGRVRTESGPPVAGAHVRLREASMRVDSSAPQRFDAGDMECSSDADGHFALHGVPLGKYFVEASHADFVRVTQRNIVVPAGGLAIGEDLVMKNGERITGVVVDAKGEPVPKADLGLRKPVSFFAGGMGLSPESAEDLGGRKFQADDAGRFSSPPLAAGEYDIVAGRTGYVQGVAKGVKTGSVDVKLVLQKRGAVEGTVISLETSEPVEEFHVAALRPFEMSKIMDMQTWEPVRHVVTVSKKGRYRIEDLAAGEYTVAVTAAGLARGEVEHVIVKEGETTHAVNFFMKKESVIRGHVVDKATHNPIEGARVSTRQGMDALQQDPLSVESEGETDGAGAFELRGLRPGRFTLTASKHGRAPGSAGPFHLGDGDSLDGITIETTLGGTIRGKVTDQHEQPETGLMISATKLGGIVPGITTTDGDGNYELLGLAAGQYTVTRLSALALGSENMTEDMLKGMQTKSVRVVDGEEVVVDFKAVTQGTVTLEGKVTRKGKPAAGILLSFAAVDAKPAPELASKNGVTDSTPLRIVTTDQDGAYKMESLTPGDWSVTVQSVANLSDNMRQTFDFTLNEAPTQHEDFDLSGTGIEGTVRRKADANPISGARVSIDAIDESVKIDLYSRRVGSRRVGELFCDQEGHYRLSGLGPGKYRVSAGGLTMLNLGTSNYARSEPREVLVTDGQMTGDIDFVLVPGGGVTGKVTANGAAVPGASMFFLRDGDPVDRIDPFSSTITDDTGNYKADGLAEGSFTVIAKAAGYAPTWKRNIGVHVGDPTTLDLALVVGGEFRLRVVDTAGQDVTGSCSLAVISSDGLDISRLVTLYELIDTAFTPGNGRSLGSLAPGAYTVTARKGDLKATLQVTHGSTAQSVDVVLSP